jgi:hypothetical protein
MVGRSLALIGRYLTFCESPKIAAASARHSSTLVNALVVRERETSETRVRTADQRTARLYGVERAGLGAERAHDEQAGGGEDGSQAHVWRTPA